MDAILQKADAYVLKLFKEQLANTFIYHNYNHTVRVVKSTEELIENSKINVKEKELLLLAAWFHDTGYVSSITRHEEESIKIASQFMRDNACSKNDIEQVKDHILATSLSRPPEGPLQEIIKDADTSHFSKVYFEEVSEFLRQELEFHNMGSFSPEEWLNENIKMFTEKHRYYTDYAIKNWKLEKDKNLIKLLEKQKKAAQQKNKLKAKYHKNNAPDRSVQTLYRTTLRNHIKLSDIADTKANILLSINAIIISFALGNIIPKLDAPSNHHLMLPTFILICFSVASIVMSILSTRPNVTSGTFTPEDITNKKVNLLFFGNFYKMPFQEYLAAMNELVQKKEDIYEALTKDLYLLGIVLNRKYKLLRCTYTVFMIGIIVSVISYIVAFYMIG